MPTDNSARISAQVTALEARQRESDLADAMGALHAVMSGEHDLAIVQGSLAGLPANIVVIQEEDCLVPVFAYISRDLAALLRNGQGQRLQPLEGQPGVLAS